MNTRISVTSGVAIHNGASRIRNAPGQNHTELSLVIEKLKSARQLNNTPDTEH